MQTFRRNSKRHDLHRSKWYSQADFKPWKNRLPLLLLTFAYILSICFYIDIHFEETWQEVDQIA